MGAQVIAVEIRDFNELLHDTGMRTIRTQVRDYTWNSGHTVELMGTGQCTLNAFSVTVVGQSPSSIKAMIDHESS